LIATISLDSLILHTHPSHSATRVKRTTSVTGKAKHNNKEFN